MVIASEAEKIKVEGNAAITRGNYKLAIDLYTRAINKDDENAVYFSNRSAAYLKIGNPSSALTDAEKCIVLNPDFAKGYFRKGAALRGLCRYVDSIKAFEEGKEKFPKEKVFFEECIIKVKKERDKNDPSSALFGNSELLEKMNKKGSSKSALRKDKRYRELFHQVSESFQNLPPQEGSHMKKLYKRSNPIDKLVDEKIKKLQPFPVTVPLDSDPRDIENNNYRPENDPTKQEYYFCSSAGEDDNPFGDGDQSPLRLKEAQQLRYTWGNGLGYCFTNLSAFGQACFLGQPDVIRLALNKFSPKNRFRLLERRETKMRFNSLLNLINGQKKLYHQKDIEVDYIGALKVLIEFGVNVNARDIAGHTGLHFCTNINSNKETYKMAKILLEQGCNIDEKNRFGMSPIFEPIMHGDLEAIDFLMRNGADVNIEENDFRTTPKALCLQRPDAARLISDHETKKVRKQMKKYAASDCCAFCEDKDPTLICSSCRGVYYCSASCQKQHWKDHKAACHESRSRKIIISPNLYHIGSSVGNVKGIIRGPTRRTLKLHPPSSDFKVKIQLDIENDSGYMMVCDEKRSFYLFLMPDHPSYDNVLSLIQTHGVMGMKAYFRAFFDDKINLHVYSGVVQVPSKW